MDRTEWPTWAEYNEEELNSLYVKLRRELFDIRLAIEQGTSSKEKEKLAEQAGIIHDTISQLELYAIKNGVQFNRQIGKRTDKGRKIK